MKIGVISDIHGHLVPLKKALALLDEHGVDQIVCAGDVVGEGYEGDAVVRLLYERQIACVRGNHDEEAFGDQAWLRKRQRADDPPNRLLLESWTTAHVSGLPLVQMFDWEGFKVCLAHGTPDSNKEYLFPLSRYTVMPDQPRVSLKPYLRIHEDSEADIFILGHTHVPMSVSFNGRWLVNAGSVSRNRTDDGQTCGVLSLPDPRFDVFSLDTGLPIEIASGQWETR